MILAEKGGVCAMFGDTCCTYIPNNTAADGSFTKALTQLRTLPEELRDNAGTDNSMWSWVDGALGKWKSFLLSGLMGCGMALAIVALLGCCVIPCVRGVILRTIDKAVSHTMLVARVLEQSQLAQADAAMNEWRAERSHGDSLYENVD